MPQNDEYLTTVPGTSHPYNRDAYENAHDWRSPPQVTRVYSWHPTKPDTSGLKSVMAKFNKMMADMQRSLSAAIAARASTAAQPQYTQNTGPSAEELQREHYQQQIDDMLQSRNAAWAQAGETLDTQIKGEMSRAALYGMDLPKITDEIRNQRQSDLFANYWDIGHEAQLQSLISKYGSSGQQTMFSKFKRGRSKDQLAEQAAKDKLTALSGENANTLLSAPSETLGSSTVLGL